MVQLEELEGKFSEFDEFIEKINEKREEVYNAFGNDNISQFAHIAGGVIGSNKRDVEWTDKVEILPVCPVRHK